MFNSVKLRTRCNLWGNQKVFLTGRIALRKKKGIFLDSDWTGHFVRILVFVEVCVMVRVHVATFELNSASLDANKVQNRVKDVKTTTV